MRDPAEEASVMLGRTARYTQWRARLASPPTDADREVFANLAGQQRTPAATAERRRDEAKELCDVALYVLWRRHMLINKQQGEPDVARSLLALGHSEFSAFIGAYDGTFVTGDKRGFALGDLRNRYWDNEVLFHEDLIRYLLRPSIQVAKLKDWTKRTESEFDELPSYGRAVWKALYAAYETLRDDPVFCLGLLVRASLGKEPVVRTNTRIIDKMARDLIVEGLWNLREPYNVASGLDLETQAGFAQTVMQAIDGAIIHYRSAEDPEMAGRQANYAFYFLANGLNGLTHPLF
jgi:hypothetical protein